MSMTPSASALHLLGSERLHAFVEHTAASYALSYALSQRNAGRFPAGAVIRLCATLGTLNSSGIFSSRPGAINKAFLIIAPVQQFVP